MYYTTRPTQNTIVRHTMDALVDSVIEAAKEADKYPTIFENTLKVYAEAYYQSVIVPDQEAQKKRQDTLLDDWSEVSNEPQTDPEISAIRRDLNYLARHLCITLPSA